MERTTAHIADKLAAETDPFLADNLRGMLETNRRIIRNPSATLRETCQFISWYNFFGQSFNLEGAGGQLDELLRPFYEADVREGTASPFHAGRG